MPQMHFPFFPNGVSPINSEIGFQKKDGKIFYFCGNMPIFSHNEDDIASFRVFLSQLYINGNATQSEIAKAFGITSINVKRSVKLLREEGPASFYSKRRGRGPTVLIPDVLVEVQKLLDQEIELAEISKKLSLKKNTLKKAIQEGRLRQQVKKKSKIL